jgi:hypothetical protein
MSNDVKLLTASRKLSMIMEEVKLRQNKFGLGSLEKAIPDAKTGANFEHLARLLFCNRKFS